MTRERRWRRTRRPKAFLHELDVIGQLVVGSLTDRGFPRRDAERVARHLLAGISADPALVTALLTSTSGRVDGLDRLALTTYLHLMGEERRRRSRRQAI